MTAGFSRASWFYTDHSHHSAILMLQKMAVIYEGADGIGVTEIQPYFNAGVLKRLSVIKRNINSVAQERLVYRSAGKIEEQEVHLVDMESVQLSGAVFDDPVLHVSLFHYDVWDV